MSKIGSSKQNLLKNGFSYLERDIYYKEEWLCEYFMVLMRALPNIKKEEGDEKSFWQIDKEVIVKLSRKKIPDKSQVDMPNRDSPLRFENNQEIIIPLELLIHNRSELYEVLKPIINFTDDLKIRHKLRDYMLFHNSIWKNDYVYN